MDSSSTRRTVRSRGIAALMVCAVSLACVAPQIAVAQPSADRVVSASYDPNIGNTGGIKVPSTQTLGDLTSVSEPDDGIATWVGGDMYVGHKVDNIRDGGPTGSYAVEAEGLTVVNGKLMMHPLKESWGGNGFRFGVVGFGSQFRPVAGSSILQVGNNTVDIPNEMKSALQSWNKPGWFGSSETECRSSANSTANDVQCAYTAQINGSSTYVWDQKGTASLSVHSGDGEIAWGISNALGENANFMEKTGSMLSAKAVSFKDTGTMAYIEPNTDAHRAYETNSFTRQKYNWNTADRATTRTYSFTFVTDNTVNKELIIEFTGTNNAAQEVFTVDASVLNAAKGKGYKGVSYSFKNVADSASIVINVDTSKTGGTVDFQNGWRFFTTDSNGIMTDIADGYMLQSAHAEQYASYAQRILWNFPSATNIVIRGGYATGDLTAEGKATNENGKPDPWESATQLTSKDDPAAALLGSILAPVGRFESHVSTNGRVWVGGDFEMFNNEVVKNSSGEEFINLEHSKTTSVIDMDQERHNFPASIVFQEDAARIGWEKIKSTDGGTLAGTKWGVYTSKENALANANPLYVVTDNQSGDWGGDGIFHIHNLEPNSNYYLKELDSGSDSWQINPNIYLIQAGEAGETVYSSIVKVFNANGGDITGQSADVTLLTDGKIQNSPTKVQWSKVDSADSTELGGSSWNLAKWDESARQYADVAGLPIADCFDNNEACAAAPLRDIDAAAGKFTLQELPIGRYRLTEQTAPAGYIASEKAYYFEITAGTSSVALEVADADAFDSQTGAPVGGEVVAGNAIGNTRATGSVAWGKVSSEEDAGGSKPYLSGSEWKLTFTPYSATGSAETITVDLITDCEQGSGTCEVGEWLDQNSARGQFELTELAWGTYTLEETKAPAGYDLPEEGTVYTFEINASNVTETIQLKLNNQAVAGNLIENTPGVVLPAAGGETPLPLTLLGCALALLSLLVSALLLRRELA